jgi:hypothetical protein
MGCRRTASAGPSARTRRRPLGGPARAAPPRRRRCGRDAAARGSRRSRRSRQSCRARCGTPVAWRFAPLPPVYQCSPIRPSEELDQRVLGVQLGIKLVPKLIVEIERHEVVSLPPFYRPTACRRFAALATSRGVMKRTHGSPPVAGNQSTASRVPCVSSEPIRRVIRPALAPATRVSRPCRADRRRDIRRGWLRYGRYTGLDNQ